MELSNAKAEWQHSATREAWELVDGGRVVGTIPDEMLPPASDWDDRPALVNPMAAFPINDPVMPMIAGFQTCVRRRFGLPLPDEARPPHTASPEQRP
jgi:hypothetical protein